MALPNATWTGKEIVTVVSRFAGLSNDSNSRSAVLDHVNLGLWEISLHTPWDWNATTASNITVSGTVATYNLPTASGSEFDEMYDVRLIGTLKRTLEYIDRRKYDNLVRGDQSAVGSPLAYTVYGGQKGGVVTLFPTPAAADTLSLRYVVRQATISDASGSSLAIGDKFIPLVIYKAAELTAAWKKPELVQYWQTKYDAVLARAIDVDRNKTDSKEGFVSGVEHTADRIDPLNPTDTAYYPL
jgi:hypothetical protein